MTAERRRLRRTVLYILVLLALLTLLVGSTYTWITLSRQPRVGDMAMYINCPPGIELSLGYDAADEAWGQTLRFADMISASSPLRPATWSQAEQSFFAMRYGIDGRGITWQKLNDTSNANRKDAEGYYVKGTFYVRTGQACTVSLAEAIELNEGENGAGTYVIGLPAWNAEEVIHERGAISAETAIRLGFRVSTVDAMNGEEIGDAAFVVYEPNCNRHIEPEIGYIPTPSIDGEETLSDKLILQTASVWEEAEPVQHEVTIKYLGKFLTDTKLFELEENEVKKIEIYIWLEGQDIDCTNKIEEAKILASIQFHVDYRHPTGIVDIPNPEENP